MEKNEKRKKILKVSGLIALFLLVFGLSYALFTVTLNGTKKVKVKTGKLELQLLDENDNPIYVSGQNNTSSYEIDLDNQVPVSDEEGLAQEGFTFKLKNNGTIDARYTIYLDDVALEQGESRISDTYVKYSLTKNNTEGTPALLSATLVDEERKLDKGVIKQDETNTYTLKVWIDEEADINAMNKVFSATLRVEGAQYIKTTPFDDGTLAATLYSTGIKGEITNVSDGFNSGNEESGLYKYTDEEGTVTYAYRGIDVNNYVSFANQVWRILRIQEDGTVKLIRDVPINYQNSSFATSSSNENGNTITILQYNQSKQLGNGGDYTYNGSYIQSYINEWYNDVLKNDYDDRVYNATYCSDAESVRTPKYNFMNMQKGIYNRTVSNDLSDGWTPSVSCKNQYEVNAKAALITADEYILAGGGRYNCRSYSCVSDTLSLYLNENYYYWTMSPAGVTGQGYANSFRIMNNGFFKEAEVDVKSGVRPVITLKSDIAISSGEGTSQSPYVID